MGIVLVSFTESLLDSLLIVWGNCVSESVPTFSSLLSIPSSRILSVFKSVSLVSLTGSLLVSLVRLDSCVSEFDSLSSSLFRIVSSHILRLVSFCSLSVLSLSKSSSEPSS
uniref:Uncharacterized protein n=1 Tax=Cacopsylla melanoneura TaxID=428564 RepID=A0A8D8V294_9HEMI